MILRLIRNYLNDIETRYLLLLRRIRIKYFVSVLSV